jgi:outer membrane protein OmpA-like peptidoglycan-associated protein
VPLRHVRWAEGSAVLDKAGQLELDELAERLMVNPDVTIEIGVHSDQRKEPVEAGKLSQKQADAIAGHLERKGVSKERIKAKGYGTSQPLNHCMKGVACSEEEHAVNRRNEYKVTGLSP